MRECCQRFPGVPVWQVGLLLEVNRGSYYRAAGLASGAAPAALAPSPENAAMALRDAIERIVLAFPGYGYRRVTHQLRRDGIVANHKRVLRVMRQESLLCQLKRRWVKTTDSEHGLRVYPNLLAHAGWQQLTGINQAWVADITSIRLRQEFVYRAVLLDAYSRRVVGWSLSRTIESDLVLAALERALATRRPAAGFIHHSDRGVQYACREYVQRLEAAGARVSMSAKATPRDNAQAERFFRTLKEEEVYLHDYETYEEGEQAIDRFIEAVYNEQRLHSALGYRPPAEFEQLCASGQII
jgi:transposase InsO family protein